MKKINAIFLALISLAFISCASDEVEIPVEASSLEIIQQAQNAVEKGKKKKAIKCYEILLQRYGNNPAIYVEGRYEIAHIYVKQKDYKKAEPILLELKEIYDSSAPGMLPGAYRKMSAKDLGKVQDKIGKKE
ncbi:MAG: hypothetical protein SPJ89_00995 [Treponema sp.]|nr:hypothetical protein [Spirochaetia bacterium]MDD7459423.1 hypothetical protein [Spirochaetales bacterium]MDY5810532.1 hypothetical protein [Treponema sp.]